VGPWSVTPEMVLVASGNASTTADDIYSELTTLQNFVENLGATWLGYASDTFTLMMAEYSIEAKKLHHALLVISELLAKSSGIYVGMEEDNVQGMQVLRSAIAPIRL
jgi:WXG100 family type VII secretion target